MNPGVSSELHFEKRAAARFDIPVGGVGRKAFFLSSVWFLTSGLSCCLALVPGDSALSRWVFAVVAVWLPF